MPRRKIFERSIAVDALLDAGYRRRSQAHDRCQEGHALISRLRGLQGGDIMMLLLAILLSNCGSGAAKDPTFPETIAPGWTRSAVSPIDASKFPALVSSAGITRGWQTEYKSSDGASARVDAYAVRSNTQGLDLVQRWRPERDNAQFYTDHFLINVAWQQAKHDELAALVRSLPKLIENQYTGP